MDHITLLAALRDRDRPHVRQLAEMIVKQTLQRPFDHYVDAQTVVAVWTGLMSREHLERQLAAHGRAALARTHVQLSKAEGLVGDLIPEETERAVLELLSRGGGPRPTWLAGTLEPTLLRELMTPVFQEVLLRFVSRLTSILGVADAPAGRSAAAASLLGRLGKDVGAGTGRRLMEMGRNVMGGLGIDLEERIRAAAREFGGAATETFREALQSRLRSAEGQALVRQLIEHGLQHVMQARLSEVDADLQRLPLSAIVDMGPALWAHNLQSELGQQMLMTEVSAWFAREGQRPLAAWLQDANILDTLQPLLVRQFEVRLGALFESDAFAAWLRDLMPTETP